jgi:putative phosphoribosyl transferase
MIYKDRRDAGKKLAQDLRHYANRADVAVLGLPRGGMPVAFEVAKALNAPLDVFLVRKLGVPGHEELAMGAIASGGIRVLNEDVVKTLNIPARVIDAVAERERRELQRRERSYRGENPPLDLEGKTIILVDDGLATGASMRAAVEALRHHKPGKVIVAVPASALETCQEFEDLVEEILCKETPQPFFGVGYWYENFEQTSDEKVRALLDEARSFIPQR